MPKRKPADDVLDAVLCGDDNLLDTAAAIGLAAPGVKPPPGLRTKVLSAIRRATAEVPHGPQVWKNWPGSPAGSLHVVRQGEGDWENVRAGVMAKSLYVDPERDIVTMLVSMQPGSTYVPHRHAGPEQCFVLEGDLHDGERVFRAGDFQCAKAGSVHNAQWTESGCLLLIVSSLNDELLSL
ncbi:MAG: cupin domain-containing protein [Bryobacteraceae bacterium]|nr:cupin domain-containing protein [Bryobacterales bacterium]NUN02707.1 cupin domain-containing protein [Bryobacteraceae bacterium]